DHGGVAPHELALEVLPIAGHQSHGDDHRHHPQRGRKQRRPRRAVQQPAVPPAQEPPGDHPRQGAGREAFLPLSQGGGGRRGGQGVRAHRRVVASRKRSNRNEASWGPGAASGWYCTDHTGLSDTANPSTVPSLRLTWVTAQEAGSDSGSTAKPWFWLVIATLP